MVKAERYQQYTGKTWVRFEDNCLLPVFRHPPMSSQILQCLSPHPHPYSRLICDVERARLVDWFYVKGIPATTRKPEAFVRPFNDDISRGMTLGWVIIRQGVDSIFTVFRRSIYLPLPDISDGRSLFMGTGEMTREASPYCVSSRRGPDERPLQSRSHIDTVNCV